MLAFDEIIRKLLVKHNYSIHLTSKQELKDGLMEKASITAVTPDVPGCPSQTYKMNLLFNRGLLDFKVNGRLVYEGLDENMFSVVWNMPLFEWCSKNKYPYNPLHWTRKNNVDVKTLPHQGIVAAAEFYMIIGGIDARTLLGLRYIEQFNQLAAHPKYGQALLMKMKECLEPQSKLPSQIYLEKKWVADNAPSKDKEVGDVRIETNFSPVTFDEEGENANIQVDAGGSE